MTFLLLHVPSHCPRGSTLKEPHPRPGRGTLRVPGLGQGDALMPQIHFQGRVMYVLEMKKLLWEKKTAELASPQPL